jgi:hypothetical protein
MARKSSIESRIISYFQTATEDAVRAVYGIASGIVKERFPRTVKVKGKKAAKVAKFVPDNDPMIPSGAAMVR